jgi:hypothetical protein
MKTSKFDSNEGPTTAISDEEVKESQPGPLLEMVELESLLKNKRTKILAMENRLEEANKSVKEERFWHQRKVPWRALILSLAVAVIVGVAVSNAVTGESNAVSTGETSEPCSCIFAGKCFDTKSELREAVDSYLADKRSDSSVAKTYGWPIGEWCVSNIQDFSHLFSVDRNPDAVNFNEDISLWDVSHARSTMRSKLRC